MMLIVTVLALASEYGTQMEERESAKYLCVIYFSHIQLYTLDLN